MTFVAWLVTTVVLLITYSDAQFDGPIVNFRIKLPEDMETKLAEDLRPENGEASELEKRLRDMHQSMDKVNRNMNLAQDALYAIQKVTGIILAKGDKFQRDFIQLQDQFKNQPSNLVEVKKRVSNAKTRLEAFQGIVDEMLDAGMETEQMRAASTALKDLKGSLLDELTKNLELLPDENKIIATGEKLSPNQKPPGALDPKAPPAGAGLPEPEKIPEGPPPIGAAAPPARKQPLPPGISPMSEGVPPPISESAMPPAGIPPPVAGI